jgi:hypothetical protein
MDTLLHEIRDPRRRFEADLAARVAALFERCPVLCGFTLHALRPVLSQVCCHPVQYDDEQREEILGAVSQMLLELVEEQPEAAELLHGRTFARTLH